MRDQQASVNAGFDKVFGKPDEVPAQWRYDPGSGGAVGTCAIPEIQEMEPPTREKCRCGHAASAHIHEEGACRPGFTCEQSCEVFAPEPKKQRRATNGDIWRATKVVLAGRNHPKKGEERRLVIEEGELVEFRFWHPANVRVRGDLYLSIEEKVFNDSFQYVGHIFPEVYNRNNNTTAEILDARLYTEEKES